MSRADGYNHSSNNRSTIFSTQEFVEFLNTQASDIAQLEVTVRTKSGLSASFTPPAAGKEDVFKSLDFMKTFLSEDSAAKPSSSFPVPSMPKDLLTSKDWTVDYARNHVDVTYNKCFTDGAAAPNIGQLATTEVSSSLPPKKRTGKTDWNALYNSALSPLIEAAARAQPQPIEQNGIPHGHASTVNPTDAIPSNLKPAANEKKRKPRKVIPTKMEYVDDYTEKDVLFGRGGRSNNHLGNKLYRDLVIEKQDFYKCCDKNEKTKVAQSIVDTVHFEQKGRFLERDPATGRYYVVPNLMARRKVGQALRENNTEEARAAKREKYGLTGKSKGESGTVSSSAASSVVPTTALYASSTART